MLSVTGNLAKMHTVLADPIEYYLVLDKEKILLNEYLGKTLRFNYLNEINCIHCGRKTKKSFQQGYCFPCLRRLSECNLCIIHPERCLVEQGGCPSDDWAHAQCNQPHIIYIANSSGLKVGITRSTQVPTRWIDQGARQALPIFTANNRYRAGVFEVALKKFMNDKTNWRAMLKNEVEDLNLINEWQNIAGQAQAVIQEVQQQFTKEAFTEVNEQPVQLHYPVLEYPTKITSLSFDKTTEVAGCLRGIKGQYLIFDTGVINVRKFSGYRVIINAP